MQPMPKVKLKREIEHTGNVDVLDDVEHVVLVDLPLLLRLQDVINGALEPVVVHGLGARQLPARTRRTPCEQSTSCMTSP